MTHAQVYPVTTPVATILRNAVEKVQKDDPREDLRTMARSYLIGLQRELDRGGGRMMTAAEFSPPAAGAAAAGQRKPGAAAGGGGAAAGGAGGRGGRVWGTRTHLAWALLHGS